MSVASSVRHEIRLVSTPLHLMSDRNVITFYEFALHELWVHRLCQFSNFSADRMKGFRSTVDMAPTSGDTLLIVSARTTVKLYFRLEVKRRANERAMSMSMFMDHESQTRNFACTKSSFLDAESKRSLQQFGKQHFFPDDKQTFSIFLTSSLENVTFDEKAG